MSRARVASVVAVALSAGVGAACTPTPTPQCTLVEGDAPVAVAAVAPGTVERVSVASGGAEAGVGASATAGSLPLLSGDGRSVGFTSAFEDLVPADTNGRRDVFRHDRSTGETVRVSVAADGGQATEISTGTAISGDGRVVGFDSTHPFVVPDLGADLDGFVHDVATATTDRITLLPDGSEAQGGSSVADLSEDGRYVLFDSEALDLTTPPQTTATRNRAYVLDRQTGVTTHVSATATGGQPNSNSAGGGISSDGRYATFSSRASNLVDTPKGNDVELYVRDLQTGTLERIPLGSGCEWSGISVSDDAGVVTVLASQPGPIGRQALIVHDRSTGTTIEVPVPAGAEPVAPVLSGDGDSLAYLAVDHAAATTVIHVYDIGTGSTTALALDVGGTTDAAAGSLAVDHDGSTVAFDSARSDLVADDTNGSVDVFVRDVDG